MSSQKLSIAVFYSFLIGRISAGFLSVLGFDIQSQRRFTNIGRYISSFIASREIFHLLQLSASRPLIAEGLFL